MAEKDIALMAHLMRRAGFGAQYDELEARAAQGYEATVEELLHPEDHPNGLDLDLAEAYFIEWNHFTRGVPEYCAFRMINSKNQLEEKMVLFWHGVLCAADSRCRLRHIVWGVEMFRRCGMGSFRELLVEISRDRPWCTFWTLSEPQRFYQRKLRTGAAGVFSMGGYGRPVNYTEADVKECARAFTAGPWPTASRTALRPLCGKVLYNPADHDNGERPPGPHWQFQRRGHHRHHLSAAATARFLSRNLYN